MPIIPGEFCADCADRGREDVPAEYELDALFCGSGGAGFLCDNCYTNAAEGAHERSLSAYYGGSGPVTIAEQCDAAAKQRADLRRRD